MDSPTKVFAARLGVAVTLAFASGFVDVIGWLSLDRLYTSHMTGNSAAFARAIVQGDAREMVTRGLPVGMFVAGALGGAVLAEVCVHRGARATIAPGLALTAALLGGFLIWASATEHAGVLPLEPAWMFHAQAALVSSAMGVQTATFRRIDNATVRTTYITGMLTNFGEELAELLAGRRAEREDLRSKARRLLVVGAIWPGFVAGACAGACGHERWHVHALMIPLALIAALAIFDLAWPVGGPSGSAAWRREQRRQSGE